MNSFPVKLSIEQILELTRQFPKEAKKILIRRLAEEIKTDSKDKDKSSINLSIEGYDTPLDLDKYALKDEMFKPLEELWKDEVSAEELAEMLIK